MWSFPAGSSHCRSVHLKPEHPESTRSDSKPKILLPCVHNAGCSQMAASFARYFGADRLIVYSAGSAPGQHLNPAVVEAMREKGIDISGESPKRLTNEMGQEAQVIITMGCGDPSSVYIGKRYLDWAVKDPAGNDLQAVRSIRDEIEQRVSDLVTELMSG